MFYRSTFALPRRESKKLQRTEIVIWKIDCHFVIDDKMSNIIELYGMHKRYERREGVRENEEKDTKEVV